MKEEGEAEGAVEVSERNGLVGLFSPLTFLS
jgi:hypothetical protein